MNALITPYRDVRRILGNALKRYRRVTPARLAHDYARAFRLRRQEPPPQRIPKRFERIVVAVTTTTERIAHIQPALRSLLDQTCPADRVLLALPTRSRRTGTLYPAPPPLPAGVEILKCEDEGPATKLLPVLRAEPNACIVVADDDQSYPADFLEVLLQAHRRDPHAALGWRGWQLPPGVRTLKLEVTFATAVMRPTEVDVLHGTWGYLVPPNALDEAVHDFRGWPPEVRWVDDVWISGHLARRGVARRVVPARGFPIRTPASDVDPLILGINRSRRNDDIAIEAFRAWW
jgi:hypothetical protein